MATLLISVALGIWGVRGWPTQAPAWVVFFGLFMSVLFLLPIGLIMAMTGSMVYMNVLSEFIGGLIVPGNAVAMNFFKTYGTITAAQAISFSSDMKMGYYAKVSFGGSELGARALADKMTTRKDCARSRVRRPVLGNLLEHCGARSCSPLPGSCPHHAFSLPLHQRFKCTLGSTARQSELADHGQLTMDNICNPNPEVAPMRMVCPGPRMFFTASILWGTLGPIRIWGVGGQYNITLIGFAFGVVLCFASNFIRKQLPNASWPKKIHTVVFLQGFVLWHIYGLVFLWPAVPVALVSWLYVRKRWLGLWSKVRNRKPPLPLPLSTWRPFLWQFANGPAQLQVQLHTPCRLHLRGCHRCCPHILLIPSRAH